MWGVLTYICKFIVSNEMLCFKRYRVYNKTSYIGGDMGKFYQGKKPDESKCWELINSFIDSFNIEWLIYEQKQKHSDEWLTYKVVANGKAINKANYWFARNIKTKQIGFARDMATMKEYKPDLFIYVNDLMETRNNNE